MLRISRAVQDEKSFHAGMEAITAATREELVARLEALPPNIKGEIIHGTLYTMPKARARHQRVGTFFGRHLGGGFDFDDDGPGGWWILCEPGVELPDAPEVVPDVAGWRRTTMPEYPSPGEPIRVVPDWLCEVLSPTTGQYDRAVKLPLYAKCGVPWIWIVDTVHQTIEVLELERGCWVLRTVVGEEQRVRIPPFDAIEMPLGRLWIPMNERLG